tara:strand:+ start:5372 stop:5836 length:465 start_codon:yes stop_codon:yes gene_type:complete
MAINQPPIIQPPVDSTGRADQVWIKWFNSIKTEVDNLILNAGGVVSLNGSSGVLTIDSDDIPQGTTNLYFTDFVFDTKFDIRLAAQDENVLAGIPLSSTLTYNADQTVSTIVKGSVTKTFTYNGDGTVNTTDDGSYTKTFSYNADGTVSAIAVT